MAWRCATRGHRWARLVDAKTRVSEIPGPVLGSWSQGRDQFWLEEWIVQATLQVLPGEPPCKWPAESGVALAEGNNTFDQLVEGGAVIRSEHLALDDREVNLDLIEPTRMHGCVHHDYARMTLA